jgi:deoxyxylulose-5-phosphate synthase
MGIPHKFIEHGDIKSLREICCLTAEKMFEKVQSEWLGKD